MSMEAFRTVRELHTLLGILAACAGRRDLVDEMQRADAGSPSRLEMAFQGGPVVFDPVVETDRLTPVHRSVIRALAVEFEGASDLPGRVELELAAAGPGSNSVEDSLLANVRAAGCVAAGSGQYGRAR
jgi:hypothetical protein